MAVEAQSPVGASVPAGVSIIIPTFREAENLPLLLPRIAQTMRARGWNWEVIVVDDDSADGTEQTLHTLAETFPQLRWTIRKQDRGLSSAVLHGLGSARFPHLVVMDADLSHPPESIPALVDVLLNHQADFAVGSRYVPGGRTEDWSAFRWLNSAVATLLCKPLVGKLRDPMAGFFAIRRSVLENSDTLNPIGYKIGLELIVKCHLRQVTEVPIVFANRVHGESKLSLREQFRYLEHLSRLYDYQFPRASPRAKFLIAAACGAAACLGIVKVMHGSLNYDFPLAMATGLLGLIGVTLAFFARYVSTQRPFLDMQRPFGEFIEISTAEFFSGWTFACLTDSNSAMVRAGVGLTVLLLVRYAMRKVFRHDLRGIRGVPKDAAAVRVHFAPQTPASKAASA